MSFLLGIDHIQMCIPLHEEERARVFYTDILQLQEIEKPDALKPNGGMWYQIGDLQLHIGTESLSTINSKRHPAFLVADIDQARTYLSEKKVPIKEDTPIPGVERFSIFDPFNNRIEILSKDKRN